MTEIFIRQMQPSDIPEILEIESISFTTPWSETAFLKEIHNPYSITRAAVLEDDVIGYVCANYIIDEGHILNLAVHPDFRRCGIGTALMKKVLSELKERGCRLIYLEVRSSNLIARRFYESLGFGIIGIRKDYYTSPKEDAVVMMLKL